MASICSLGTGDKAMGQPSGTSGLSPITTGNSAIATVPNVTLELLSGEQDAFRSFRLFNGLDFKRSFDDAFGSLLLLVSLSNLIGRIC